MLATLALFVASQVTPITLNVPIQPLAATVKVLSERTGQNLSIAPNLGGEMVLVRVKDAPLDTVLAKIAHCTHAEWVRDGDRLRLARSLSQERSLADAAIAYRTEIATRALAKVKKETEATAYRADTQAERFRAIVTGMVGQIDVQSPEGQERYRKQQAAAQSTLPAFQAARQLAPHLDFISLVKGPSRRGITYSTHPKGVQRPFPPAAQAVLDRYGRDQIKFLDTLSTWDRMAQRSKPEAVGRILVHISHRRDKPSDAYLRLNFYAMAEDDHQVAECMIDIEPEVVPSAETRYDPPRLSLPPLSVALEEAYGFSEVKVTPEIKRMLRHADQAPRFRHAWSETLPAIARTPNVVADVSDSLEHWFTTAKGEVDLSNARNSLLDEHEITTEDGWTVIRPRFSDAAGVARYHRPTEAQLVRIIDDHDPLAIEHAVVIPARDRDVGHLGHNPLFRNYDDFGPGFEVLASEEALSLLATLEPNLRARFLRTGGALSGPQFGPALRAWIFEQLLIGETLQFADRDKPASDTEKPAGLEPNSAEQFNFTDALILSFLRAENVSKPVSDFLNDQTISQTRLTVRVDTEPALIQVGKSEYGTEMIRKDGIAYALTVAADHEGPEPLRFRPARFRLISLRLDLGGGFYREYQIGDWQFDPMAKPLPPAELPAWVKEGSPFKV